MQIYRSIKQPPCGVSIVDKDGNEWIRVIQGWCSSTVDMSFTWAQLRNNGPLCSAWCPPPEWLDRTDTR